MDISDTLKKIVDTATGKLPSVIYHYTSTESFINIISNSEMWFTKANSLNDPYEEKYGRDLVSEIAKQESESAKNEKEKKFLNSVALNIVEKIFHTNIDYYLASFSENGDDISHWKSYSDDGTGYSIGLNVGAKGIDPEYVLPVIYKKEIQVKTIKQCLSETIGFLKTNNFTTNAQNSAYEVLVMNLNLLIISMKQPSYESEKELRMVFIPHKEDRDKNVQFRSGRDGRLIPYLSEKLLNEFEVLENLPISKVIYGPRSDDNNIKSLLISKGYTRNIDIVGSKILYRG